MSTNNSTQSPQSNVVELSVTIASKKEQRHYVGHEVVIFQRVEGKMVRLSEASKGGDSDMVIVQKTQEKASYQPLKLPLNKTFINRQGELFVEAFEFSQNNYGQVLVGNGGTPQCFEEKVDEGSARFFLSFGKERTLFTISYNGFAKEHRIVRHRIKVSKDGLTVNLQSEQVHYTKEGEIRKGFESLQAAFDAVEEKVESKKQGLFFVAKPAGEISLPTQEQVAA